MQLWEPRIRIPGNPSPGLPSPHSLLSELSVCGSSLEAWEGCVCPHVLGRRRPSWQPCVCVCARACVHARVCVCAGPIQCVRAFAGPAGSVCVSICIQVHPLTQHPHLRMYEQVHTFQGWDIDMLLSKPATPGPTASHYCSCVGVFLCLPDLPQHVCVCACVCVCRGHTLMRVLDQLPQDL